MVVVTSVVPGMTQEMYEGMSAQMMAVIKAMPGFIAHAGMQIPGGWQVVEFWQSREQFDAWYESGVKASVAAAGLRPIFTYAEATQIFTH